MNIKNSGMVLVFLSVLTLVGCGGGGGGGSAAPSAAVVSTLSFPLQNGMNAYIARGSLANYVVSGSCSGNAGMVNLMPASAVFEGVSGVSVASTQTINLTNCLPSVITGNAIDYYDANYVPLGRAITGGDYSVYISPPVIPAQVKVGNTGSMGTLNNFFDSTKTVPTGKDVMSFVIEADTANTAIVNMMDRSYNTLGVLLTTTQDRYRIDVNGRLTPISSDIQQANGSTIHLVLTALPDTLPPSVLSTNPLSNSNTLAASSTISATFSEPIDPATVTASTFRITDGTGLPVAGTVTYSGLTAAFTPTARLAPLTTYTATITNGVKDLAGNPLVSNYTWSFTTNASVLMNPRTTTIGSPTEGVAIGDVNGDGKNDVVVTTSSASVITGLAAPTDYKLLVFIQNATGGLNPPILYATTSTISCRATSVAVGDINNDGKQDVAIGNTGCGIEVMTQNALGGLNPGVVYASLDSGKIRIADLNNDGKQDIVGVGSGLTASIWLQNVGGTLNASVPYPITGATDLDVGDVNNDGLIDIVVSGTSVGVLTQTVAGIFNAPVYYTIAGVLPIWGVAVGDVTGDTLNDIVVTYGGNRPSSMIGVFSQGLLGTINPAVSYTSYDIPSAIEIADITGDGRKDIITLHNGWGMMGTYQQLANGTMQAEFLYPIPNYSLNNLHGLVTGDINSDGKNDVVYIDPTAGLVAFYHN
ncbi:MAG: FG-GAP-like repeat-containing protein [Gallionella sp.]|nr:FG-GAP-like repeat-containing protein [Gallionella sp.]MDD4958466.1 FG-GAP-like repeat-containing protein [Gallionella sp.]